MFSFSSGKSDSGVQEANVQISLMHEKLQKLTTECESRDNEVQKLIEEKRTLLKSLEEKEKELKNLEAKAIAYEGIISSFCESEDFLRSLLREISTAKSLVSRTSCMSTGTPCSDSGIEKRDMNQTVSKLFGLSLTEKNDQKGNRKENIQISNGLESKTHAYDEPFSVFSLSDEDDDGEDDN